MAIIISILMSLGIISNPVNNDNTSFGYNETRGDNYTATSKGGVDWAETH